MKPNVQPLARWHRKLIFILLVCAFLFSMPVFMFYATGYRYDFFSKSPSITVTGGMYVAVDALDGAIFVDETEVKNARDFRNASYINGVTPGLHRLHVQAPRLYTWVKELSVYPHLVTEAESFNLPLVPQIRPVTQYETVDGAAIFVVKGTSSVPFILDFASSSIPFFSTTTKATSTFSVNQEYALLKSLFEEKASSTKKRLVDEEAFGFATSTKEDNISSTSTVTKNNITLYKAGEEVFAKAIGTGKQIPHYYCTSELTHSSSTDLGKDLQTVLEEQGETVLTNKLNELSATGLTCRTDIRIDRKWQNVIDFTFYPGNEDLILMHLEEGIYVVEIDDRAWQNTQVLYPGKNLMMLVEGNSIFIKDGSLILEALTELIVP